MVVVVGWCVVVVVVGWCVVVVVVGWVVVVVVLGWVVRLNESNMGSDLVTRLVT